MVDDRHPRERDKVTGLITIVREVVALDGDSKIFVANYLGKFLVALDDV